MQTDWTCPRCNAKNESIAIFCRQCGAPIDGHAGTAGRVTHPKPLETPPDFQLCEEAANLHYRAESAWGGPRLLQTEGIGIVLFNAGYPLQDVLLKVEGRDETGESIFAFEIHAENVPRGKTVRLEIPSYEISHPASRLTVTLVSAEYSPMTTQDP